MSRTKLSRYYIEKQLEKGVSYGISTALETEYFTLSSITIAKGYVKLTHAPTNESSVTAEVVGAPTQERDIDYKIEGDRVIWSGRAWESILKTNDVLKVTYTRYIY